MRFDFCTEMYGAPAKKCSGPEKRDASISLGDSERYDIFDSFRPVSITAIDRGIGMGRFGVEKTTFDFCREMYGAPAKKIVRAPKSAMRRF